MVQENRRDRSERRSEPSLRAAHHTEVHGLDLSWKVALAATACALLCLSWSFTTAYRSTQRQLDRAFDQFGAHLVQLLAAPDVAVWTVLDDSVDGVARRITELTSDYAEYLRVKFGITVDEPKEGPDRKHLSERFRLEQQNAIEGFRKLKESQGNPLAALLRVRTESGPVPTRIVDACILKEGTRTVLARASSGEATFMGIEGARAYQIQSDSGLVPTETRIADGLIEGLGNVRSFSHPIRDEADQITHRAFVLLSSGVNEAALDRLFRKAVLLTLFLAGLTGAIIFALMRRFTAPLRELVEDTDRIAAGELDHPVRAHASRAMDEVGILARSVGSLARRFSVTLHAHDQELADDVHRKVVPEAIPYVHGFDLNVIHKLPVELGGSYHDFLDLPEHKIGVLIVQSSGRGITADMNAAIAGALIRAEALKQTDPARILMNADDPLRRSIHADMHISATLAVISPKSDEVVISGAGDLPLCLYRAVPGAVSRTAFGSNPLGLGTHPADGATYSSKTLRLEPDDHLILTNGGVLRLENLHGVAFGAERFDEVLLQAGRQKQNPFDEELRQGISIFLGRAPVNTDVVIIDLLRQGAKVSSS